MASECRQIDVYRRSDYVGRIKEDTSVPGCVIIGQTANVSALDTDKTWQLRRITNVAGEICTDFADHAKYSQSWTDRLTSFPACPPGVIPLPTDLPLACNNEAIQALQYGLCGAGRFRAVTVIDSGWTALVGVVFTRNVIAVQHRDLTNPSDVKINWPPDATAPVGYVGMLMRFDEERQYDIRDNVLPYARVEPGGGSVILGVEEIE